LAGAAARQIVAQGRVIWPFLGLVLRTLVPGDQALQGAPAGAQLSIVRVEPGSAVAAAGVQARDVLVALNGRRVRTFEDVFRIVLFGTVGQHVRVDLFRGGEARSVDLVLVPRP